MWKRNFFVALLLVLLTPAAFAFTVQTINPLLDQSIQFTPDAPTKVNPKSGEVSVYLDFQGYRLRTVFRNSDAYNYYVQHGLSFRLRDMEEVTIHAVDTQGKSAQVSITHGEIQNQLALFQNPPKGATLIEFCGHDVVRGFLKLKRRSATSNLTQTDIIGIGIENPKRNSEALIVGGGTRGGGEEPTPSPTPATGGCVWILDSTTFEEEDTCNFFAHLAILVPFASHPYCDGKCDLIKVQEWHCWDENSNEQTQTTRTTDTHGRCDGVFFCTCPLL